MKPQGRFGRMSPLVLIGLAFLGCGEPSRAPQASLSSWVPISDEAPYDPNPEHLWNRLYRHFHERKTPEGAVYYLEQMENAIFTGDPFELGATTGEEGIALLDEFLRSGAERLVRDPEKRTLFQRDLWGMFVATALPEVQRRLAVIIRKVALNVEEIERLPDNLAVAVRMGAFQSSYDPANPRRPFLPPDLLDPSGPWVPFTRRDRETQPAAKAHVIFTRGRAVFLPLLRLPGGREDTQSYLTSMDEGPLPQFERGTQTALLRRLITIDDQGMPRLTRLTESLQIRVFDDLGGEKFGRPIKFFIRRSDLFAGRNGGLHPIGREDRSQFEIQTCQACHARLEQGGVATLQTLRTGGDTYSRGPFMRVGALAPAGPTDLPSEARYSIDWLQTSTAWKLLKSLW